MEIPWNRTGMVPCCGSLGLSARRLAVPVFYSLPGTLFEAGIQEAWLFEGDAMNTTKIAAIVLILAGALGLVYGSFSYTKETHETKIGPIELSIKDKQTVNVPVWAGVGAIVLGGVVLVFGSKKS
jgi:hypothetical protein